MMGKVLVWYEAATMGFQYTWIDRFVSYHGHELRLIDRVGQFLPRKPGRVPVAYRTLDEALEDMSDHKWVFLHPDGGVILDGFRHPPGDKVVYAFGSDATGFGQDVRDKGPMVRLREPGEIHVMHALPYVLYDRSVCLLDRFGSDPTRQD